jgi:hypothetical protein
MMNDDCLNWEAIIADDEMWSEYELEIEGAVEMRKYPCLL